MQTITKETLKQDIDHLNDQQLKQIADFIAFLKFQSKISQITPDFIQFSNLYQEFADEDRELAEMGMSEYTQSLEHEDQL
jgi:ABC-type taurine transport system substrate-binding protein